MHIGSKRGRLMHQCALRAALAIPLVEEAANVFAFSLALAFALAFALAAALSLSLLCLLGFFDHLAIVIIRARVARLTLCTITNHEAQEGFLAGDYGQGDSLLPAGLRETLSQLVCLTFLASLLHKMRRRRIQEVVTLVLMTELVLVDVRDLGRQPRNLTQQCIERGVQMRHRWLHLEKAKQGLPSIQELCRP